MSETTSERIFDRELIVADHFRLRLIRETDSDGEEMIFADIPDGQFFGDWLTTATHPDPVRVAKDCSAALGATLDLDEIMRFDDSDRITLYFLRSKEAPKPQETASKPEATQSPPEPVQSVPGASRPPCEAISEKLQEAKPAAETAKDDPALTAAAGEAGQLVEAQATLKRIYAQRRVVSLAYQKAKAAKTAAAASKQQWELERDTLENLIREFDEGAELPLFDAPKPAATSTSTPAAAPKPTTPAAAPGSEAWRKIELASLGLSEAILKKLADAEIITVGDLQRYQEEKSSQGYGDPIATIKGIGPTSAQKIADALSKVWERNFVDATAAPAETKPPAEPPPAPAAEPAKPAPDLRGGLNTPAIAVPPVITTEAKPAEANGHVPAEPEKPKRKRRKKEEQTPAMSEV